MKTNQIVCAVTILVNLLGLFSINIEPVRANPQQCYKVAIDSINNYSSDTANAIAFMCQGATSTKPGECFAVALSPGFTKLVAQRVAMLCKGATSTAPGKCFLEMLPNNYTDTSVERAFTLCKTPEPSRDDRGESDRHHPDREEPRGAWQLTMNDWTGILRMHGHHGTLILVFTKTGEIIEEKMELETSSEQGYILKGTVVTATKKNPLADNLFISQFSKETTNIRDCDPKGCYDMTLTYLGE
jgi:hypothetical protein